MTVLLSNEWWQNRARCPWFQCSQLQGPVTQTLGVSWTEKVLRETPLAGCHRARMPSCEAELPVVHHKRQPHKKPAAGAHLDFPHGQRLRKHIRFNMSDTLRMWLEFGMKTSLRYIHHDPQCGAGLCDFSKRKVSGEFKEQHSEIQANRLHNRTYLSSPGIIITSYSRNPDPEPGCVGCSSSISGSGSLQNSLKSSCRPTT